MQTPQLFTLLPEEWVATPDGMTIDKDGKSFVNINVFARDLELYGQQRANA